MNNIIEHNVTLQSGLSIETWYYTAQDLISGKCPDKVIELANATIKADKELVEKDILFLLRQEDVNAFKIRIKGAAGDKNGEMCLFTYATEMDLNTGVSIYDREEVFSYKSVSIADIKELLKLNAIATSTIPGRVYSPSGIIRKVKLENDEVKEYWVLDATPEEDWMDIFK